MNAPDGKAALVTGGSSGNGRARAPAFARCGRLDCALTRTAAFEGGRKGIRFNALVAGASDTQSGRLTASSR